MISDEDLPDYCKTSTLVTSRIQPTDPKILVLEARVEVLERTCRILCDAMSVLDRRQ